MSRRNILLAVISLLAASGMAAGKDIGLQPMFFGLHLNQAEGQVFKAVPELTCDATSSGIERKCTAKVQSSFAGVLDLTVEFADGISTRIVLRSPTEEGCRGIVSQLHDALGKAVAKKSVKLGSLPTDIVVWSDAKDVKQSTWGVMSLCSPNGPGRAIVFPASELSEMFP